MEAENTGTSIARWRALEKIFHAIINLENSMQEVFRENLDGELIQQP